jgi:hypothetical protein
MLVFDCSSLSIAFSFSGGVQARVCTGLFSRGGGELGNLVWCVMLTCNFCSFSQAGLELAVEEKWFPSEWHKEAFHGVGVQDVTGFDSD